MVEPDPGERGIAEPVRARAEQDDASRGRPVHPTQEVEEGGLAASGRTGDREEGAALDGERDPAERVNGAAGHGVRLRDVLRPDDRGIGVGHDTISRRRVAAIPSRAATAAGYTPAIAPVATSRAVVRATARAVSVKKCSPSGTPGAARRIRSR